MSETISRLNAALTGRYEVHSEIGAGGMATVFLAQDLKHNRRVALKVLKPELAAVVGAERFLSEIETTANLQHPHILPLHDSGEADTFLYYVMPFVDGETLRERLERERQLPVADAIGIAASLASALDHAHRKGIIHRDIKPANILLQDGQPVIADFGIALAVGSAGGARLTETGLSVGTPYYMSPEQATGDQHIGPQSDIYSLTCVFYEMLVGEPPFPGATAQAVLGRIISGQYAPVTRQRSAIAPNVDSAIRKGLEKVAADRFATAADFKKALEDPGFRHGDVEAELAQGKGWKRVAIAAIAASAVFGGMAAWSVSAGGEAPVSRFGVILPEGHDPSRTYGANVAIAPDGSRIVYVGPSAEVGVSQQLWIRARDQLEPTPLNGTDFAQNPVFSPDGTEIAFQTAAPNEIKVVSLTGAPPFTVADEGVNQNSIAWGDDGLLYSDLAQVDGGGIGRLSATGGEIERVTTLDSVTSEAFHAWHQVLPGSQKMVATIGYNPASNADAFRIALFDLESGERQIVAAGVLARYVPTGHLIYISADGQLLASTFDPDEAELGPPVVLAEGLAIGQFGSADLDIAADGTLVYMVGSLTSALGRAVWVDRDGLVTEPDPEWAFDPGMPEAALVLSPDGTRLAAKINTDAGDDIWVKELPDGPLSRLTFDDGIDRRPRWSADGTRIFYNSDRDGEAGSHYDLWVQPSDGTGVPEKVLDLEASILEARLTPDESAFVLRLGGLSGAVGVRDLVGLRVGETETFPVATESYDEKGVALSPSGRWVAYESTETGRDEVYVRPFPDAQGGKWQVSTQGGINPKWAPDEEELFFVDGSGNLVAAQVDTNPSFRVGQRQTLFSMTERFLDGAPNYASWDVDPDGERFMMLQIGGGDDEQRGELIVVQNFFQVLEERVER